MAVLEWILGTTVVAWLGYLTYSAQRGAALASLATAHRAMPSAGPMERWAEAPARGGVG